MPDRLLLKTEAFSVFKLIVLPFLRETETNKEIALY
jgi:hypothetical protein